MLKIEDEKNREMGGSFSFPVSFRLFVAPLVDTITDQAKAPF